MNIVLYVNSFLPNPGGKEMVVHHLAKALFSLGHKVRVMCSGGFLSERGRDFGYPLHRWPVLPDLLQEPFEQARLFFETALFGCDVLHAHVAWPCGYAAVRLKRMRNVPLVITPHGDDIHVIPEIGRGLRLNPVLRPKIDHALEGADLVTAISSGVEASLHTAGVPVTKIRNIPNGVDTDRFRGGTSSDVTRWLGLPPESRLLLTVGNYRPVKGHEVLIRSMPRILEQSPDARLVIVGGGTSVLRPLIHSLNLDEAVCLTGPVRFPVIASGKNRPSGDATEPDRLAAIYSSSVLYVSAGVGEGAEGLPLSVLDALAAGLPVVASDISGNREVINDGRTGVLVPPGDSARIADAVLTILSRDELRTRMGACAKAVAAQYQWREIARQYLAVYDEALGLSARKPAFHFRGAD